jgi:hypothetical protein
LLSASAQKVQISNSFVPVENNAGEDPCRLAANGGARVDLDGMSPESLDGAVRKEELGTPECAPALTERLSDMDQGLAGLPPRTRAAPAWHYRSGPLFIAAAVISGEPGKEHGQPIANANLIRAMAADV